ncbi:tetratricopeptide repeat protein [bacterium]|nr:tetratricopeptide repeat protein [bacterium]
MSFRTIPYWTFAFLLLVALQALWRQDVLIQPPYWSAALGVFTHASALTDDEVPLDASSTPAAFQISLVPRLLAGLMQILPPRTPTILAFRLCSFAMAALVLLGIVSILYRRAGWVSAALAAGAVISTPLFAVQAELMGEQIFLVGSIVLSISSFAHRRFVWAGVLGIIAFFFHWFGLIYLIAGSVILLGRFAKTSSARSWAGLFTHLLGIAIALGTMLYYSLPEHPTGGWIASESFGVSPLTQASRWAPDVIALTSLAALSTLFLFRPTISTTIDPDLPDSPVAISILSVVGLISLLAITGAVPGQLALVVPLVIMTLAWQGSGRIAFRPWIQGFFYALIAWNLFNATGRLLPPLAEPGSPDLRTGSLLERSREYLIKDHVFVVDAVREILMQARDKRIVAGTPMQHFLSLPALGYVSEPFAGYSLDLQSLPRFGSLESVREDDPHPLAFVHLWNRFAQESRRPIPKPVKGDHPIFPRQPAIFENPFFKASPLYVFVPREVPSDSPEEAKRRYLRRLWPEEVLFSQAIENLNAGNLREAEPLLRKLLDIVPSHHAARFALALLCEKQGRGADAIDLYQQIPRTYADYWQAEVQIGQILTAQGEFKEAVAHYQAALEAFKKLPQTQPMVAAQILVRWANAEMGREDFARAEQLLVDAVAIGPTFAGAQRELGFVLFKEHRHEEAAAALEKARQLDPNDPITYRYLGANSGALGQWEKSADAFREGLLLLPSDAQSLDGLITSLLRLERYDEVIDEIEDAMAARPDETMHISFLSGLAEALCSRGEWPRGIATLERAVDLAPESKDVANQLAWVLATSPDDQTRNGTKALQAAKILSDEEKNSIYLDTLAAVHAELGQWDLAMEKAQQAITAASSDGQSKRIPEFQERLEMYRNHQPYRTSSPAAP